MARPHLRLDERIELELALGSGDTQAAVAARLGRSPGTISRERRLHGGRAGYRVTVAHAAACARRGPARRGVAATQGQLKAMVLVDQRPPEVETRLIAGHFEGDLILGAGNRSAVGVLVERTTRCTFRCHLPQKDAATVRAAFTRKLRALAALSSNGTRLALDNYEATAPLGACVAPAAHSAGPGQNVALRVSTGSLEGIAPLAPTVLTLGPERGWSPEDRALLRTHNFMLAHLGRRPLRMETAVIASLAVLKAAWNFP